MKRFKLYTHKYWSEYAWESMNPSQYMAWDVRRCNYGDPHPPPSPEDDVFYTCSELEHALNHHCRTKTALMLEVRPVVPGFYEYLEEHIEVFDRVLTHDIELCDRLGDKAVFFAHGNCTLRRADHKLYDKTRLASFISTPKNLGLPGHALRHSIFERATQQSTPPGQCRIAGTTVDLYGAIANRSLPYKLESLRNYCFQVAVENCKRDIYFTEKIIDCFVAGTIPIYYGTERIGEHFDLDGILCFSTVDEFEEICGQLSFELYETMRSAAVGNFQRAMRYLLAEDWIAENTDVFGEYYVPDDSRAIPSVTHGDSPDAPPPVWMVPGLEAVVANDQEEPERVHGLKIVTTHPKQTVQQADEVPEALIRWSPVTTLMQAPRTLDNHPRRWYPPYERGFLMKVPGGFMGDNVIFDDERYYSFGRWWLGDTWRLYERTREVRSLDVAISIAAWGGEAFQHFVLDALPRLGAVIDALEQPELEHVKLLTHNFGCQAGKWFFHELGLEHRLEQKPISARHGFVYQARLALYHDFEPNAGQGIYPRGILRPIQLRLGVLEDGPQDLVLYLHRPANRKRSVANENTLLEKLLPVVEAAGCKLHIFQSHEDTAADRDLFKRARLVLGPHGGAFANLVFTRPGTPVIEFSPLYRMFNEGVNPRAVYWGLAQAASLDYWVVEPSEFDFDSPQMVVDEKEVVEIARHLLMEDK